MVYWLVDHGDVQSVVSKFDIKKESKVDHRYESLKKISLFDHSFNTCLHAYRITTKGNQIKRPTIAYLAALAGLIHDIGKHPLFYPREGGKSHYRSSDHPIYSVDAARYFVSLVGVDGRDLLSVFEAVAKHHMDNPMDRRTPNLRPLPYLLQQADRAARQDEMSSMKVVNKDLEALQQKETGDYLVIDEDGLEEGIKITKPSRTLNLNNSEPVPAALRASQLLKEFFEHHLAKHINRYNQDTLNLDLNVDNRTYGSFTHGNDLMVRMSLLENLWEEFAQEKGVTLRTNASRYPMQSVIKGLLRHLDQVEPGLVQRPLLPDDFAFLRIQVRQGQDRWTKTANYIPFNLNIFTEMTGINPAQLEERKAEEDHLAGRNFLSRICGWRKEY